MRTTIEISNKHRGKLLSLAAQRGLRGYSRLIEEALEYYFKHYTKSEEMKKDLLKMKGSWKAEETGKVEKRINDLRQNWNR